MIYSMKRRRPWLSVFLLLCGILLLGGCQKETPPTASVATEFRTALNDLTAFAADSLQTFPEFPDLSARTSVEVSLHYGNRFEKDRRDFSYVSSFGTGDARYECYLSADNTDELVPVTAWYEKGRPTYVDLGTNQVIQTLPSDTPEIAPRLPILSGAPKPTEFIRRLSRFWNAQILDHRIYISAGEFPIPETDQTATTRITLTLGAQQLTELGNILESAIAECGLTELIPAEPAAILKQSAQLTWHLYTLDGHTVRSEWVLVDSLNRELARLDFSLLRTEHAASWSLTADTDAAHWALSDTHTGSSKNGLFRYLHTSASGNSTMLSYDYQLGTPKTGFSVTGTLNRMEVSDTSTETLAGNLTLVYTAAEVGAAKDRTEFDFTFYFRPKGSGQVEECTLNATFRKDRLRLPPLHDRMVLPFSIIDPDAPETQWLIAQLYYTYPEWMTARYGDLLAPFDSWNTLSDPYDSWTSNGNLYLVGGGCGTGTFSDRYTYIEENGIVVAWLRDGSLLHFIYSPDKEGQIVAINGEPFEKNYDELASQNRAVRLYLGSTLSLYLDFDYVFYGDSLFIHIIGDDEIRVCPVRFEGTDCIIRDIRFHSSISR